MGLLPEGRVTSVSIQGRDAMQGQENAEAEEQAHLGYLVSLRKDDWEDSSSEGGVEGSPLRKRRRGLQSPTTWPSHTSDQDSMSGDDLTPAMSPSVVAEQLGYGLAHAVRLFTAHPATGRTTSVVALPDETVAQVLGRCGAAFTELMEKQRIRVRVQGQAVRDAATVNGLGLTNDETIRCYIFPIDGGARTGVCLLVDEAGKAVQPFPKHWPRCEIRAKPTRNGACQTCGIRLCSRCVGNGAGCMCHMRTTQGTRRCRLVLSGYS